MRKLHAESLQVVCRRLDSLEELILRSSVIGAGLEVSSPHLVDVVNGDCALDASKEACCDTPTSPSSRAKGVNRALKIPQPSEMERKWRTAGGDHQTQAESLASKDMQIRPSSVSSARASRISAPDTQRRSTRSADSVPVWDSERRERSRWALRGSMMALDPTAANMSDLQVSEAEMSGVRGVLFSILTSSRFDFCMGLVIVLNSIVIGVELSLAKDADAAIENNEARMTFSVLEHVFVALYTFETAIRILTFGWTCLRHRWVLFDFVLVILGIVGSWILPLVLHISSSGSNETIMAAPTVFRMFRLARLARALRLFVQFRTLWLLVSGIILCLPTVVNVLIVLSLAIYVFACIGIEVITNRTDLSSKSLHYRELVDTYWNSLPRIMLTLLQMVTLDSVGPVYSAMIVEDSALAFFFLPFILIVSIILMNLVTAVVIEVFVDNKKKDFEARKQFNEHRVKQMVPKLREMFRALDTEEKGLLSLGDLEEAPEELLHQLKMFLNVDSVIELFDALDLDGSGEVNVEEFCSGIVQISVQGRSLDVIRTFKMLQLIRQDLGFEGECFGLDCAHFQMGGESLESPEKLQQLTFQGSFSEIDCKEGRI